MSRLLTDPKEQSGGWYIAQEEADAQLAARESVWQPRRRVALLEYTAAPPRTGQLHSQELQEADQ